MPTLEGNVGLSTDAYFAWDVESTYGTAATFTSADSACLFLSESLKSELLIQTPTNISRAFRDVNQVYLGRETVSGDVQFACVYQGMEHLWLHAFGAVSSPAGASDTYDLTFDLTSKGRYKVSTAGGPSFTAFLSRGVVGSGQTNNTVFTYAGMVVDQAVWSCTQNGPLLCTLSLFGKSEAIAVDSTAPTYVSTPVINGTDCSVTWGGVAIPVSDFTITMRRQIDRERFFLGQTQTAEPPMGQYEVTCDFTTEWDNETRAGSTTLRADYIAQTARALNFTFTSDANVPGASEPYLYTLSLPQGVITQFPPNVPGVGRSMVNMQVTGYDSSLDSTPHELRLTNTVGDDYNDA